MPMSLVNCAHAEAADHDLYCAQVCPRQSMRMEYVKLASVYCGSWQHHGSYSKVRCCRKHQYNALDNISIILYMQEPCIQ